MSRDSKTYLIFVYGTLKSGQPNHSYMAQNDKVKRLGTGELTRKFPLVVGTQYNLPFLLLAEGNGENVEGEIYTVDDDMLAWLDKFESHPSWYRRELTEVKVTSRDLEDAEQHLSVGDTCNCWVYFLPKFKPEMLELKMLKSYSSVSDDHAPYVEGEDLTSFEDS